MRKARTVSPSGARWRQSRGLRRGRHSSGASRLLAESFQFSCLPLDLVCHSCLNLGTQALLDEHAVAIGIEAVALGDGVAISVEHVFFSAQGAHQHEQRGLWQVEVGEQRAYDLKFVGGIDKEIGFCRAGANFTRPLLGGVFQGSDRRRTDRDHSPVLCPRARDLFCGFGRDRTWLRVQLVVFDFLDSDGLEGAKADVQRNLRRFDVALAKSRKNLRCEVQTGGRRGHRSALPGVDRLVAVAVVRRVFAPNVGRERDVADVLDGGEEVVEVLPDRRWGLSPHVLGREADVAFAEFSTGDDFCLQFVVFSEKQMLANRDLPSGPDQALPLIGIGLQLAGQEDFNAPAKKVARCGIMRTENLRLKTSAAAIQTRGKHPGVVEDDEVVGAEQVREIAELTIRKSARCGGKVKKARRCTVGEGLLGDQFFRQIVMKIGDQHAAAIITFGRFAAWLQELSAE